MPKCRVFSIDHGLKEVVADGLYMKHMFGETISVAVVKFVETAGTDLPAKSHSHGEEASLQFTGACSVFEGAGEAGDHETIMEEGDALLIPADLMHYGSNRFGPAGVSMRLNVVTPARREYGAEDTVPYYPLADRVEKS
ncbi:cupin [Cupriavidus necator]|uniref:Cupin n=1 Tax=Cupriavidus necator TaxID=106590 RepID=A0A367P9M0_CUPNE|nr:cupin [Cupriavidus necator]QQX86046.1 cupin [Cupriavidus necator]RCJ04540.1 cupin [Cupriavidus necator]